MLKPGHYYLAPGDFHMRIARSAVGPVIKLAQDALRRAHESGENAKFLELATPGSMQLQSMVDAGGAIVHGHDASLNQEAINELF